MSEDPGVGDGRQSGRYGLAGSLIGLGLALAILGAAFFQVSREAEAKKEDQREFEEVIRNVQRSAQNAGAPIPGAPLFPTERFEPLEKVMAAEITAALTTCAATHGYEIFTYTDSRGLSINFLRGGTVLDAYMLLDFQPTFVVAKAYNFTNHVKSSDQRLALAQGMRFLYTEPMDRLLGMIPFCEAAEDP